MSQPRIASIRSRFSKPINNWSTSSLSGRSVVSACSSKPAPAIYCCKANARNFSPSNGLRSTPPFSGSASHRKISWMLRKQVHYRPLPKRKGRSVEPMACIEARGLRKVFGTTIALDGVDLRVEEGRILGLIGPNGAGKTTALNAILGLTTYQGELKVLGRDPWTDRDQLMRDVSFIADVAGLQSWIR